MLKFVMFLYARYSVFYKKLNNYKFGFLDYDFQVRVRSYKCKWSLNSQKKIYHRVIKILRLCLSESKNNI